MTDQLKKLFDELTNKIDELAPLFEVIEAKKKLLECAMWVDAAIEEDQ